MHGSFLTHGRHGRSHPKHKRGVAKLTPDERKAAKAKRKREQKRGRNLQLYGSVSPPPFA